ncbi:hypothetical protein BHE74_00033647 [Ensete ventricosum]|nr:hypothetical protein BHE74_00033647 [Ensete ventricosum]
MWGACPTGYKVDGKTWVDPPRCSVFGLLVGRSCDIDPPSNVKNVTKLSGVELRCRLDLCSSECASPPTSVGIETSYVDWCSLDSPHPERRSVCPSGRLEDDDPAHRPLREWEG